MPSLGSIRSTCVRGATEEVKAFTCALRDLIPFVGPGVTMAAKAGLLSVSPPLLSHWLCGRRLPLPEVLKKLYDLADEGVRKSPGAALSCSFAELEELLVAARKSTCRRCRGGCACSRGNPDRRNASSPTDASSLAAEAEDRRNTSLKAGCHGGGAGEEYLDLPRRLHGLPLAGQVNVLWNLGVTMDEGEIGAAAKALGGAGMNEEMEIIIRAAESAGKDTVKIMIAFSRGR